jgi:DNA invertase Pin-like site-specific DNA recombinase
MAMRGYRRARKVRRRRCASFAPPEQRRCSGKWQAGPRPTDRSFAGCWPRSTPATWVTRLDRLARSTRDLLNTLAVITGKEAGFRSLADAWADTTTAHGRLMLTVLGGLAEFERELIRARTGEGRERAGARGQSLGRPFKLTPHQRSEAIQRRDRGEPLGDIARSYNVHPSTISRLTA